MDKENNKLLDELDVLKDVSEKLIRGNIPFMLTGSIAMNYYAKPRMTRDIDIVISLKKADIEKVLSLFQKEYYISTKAVVESIENKSMFNIIHKEGVIKVDFIILSEDPYEVNKFEKRKKIKIRDFYTFIISKEDLIISKLKWLKESGSEIQKEDIKNLIKTGYDKEYLNNWVKELGLEREFEKIVA